MFAVLIIVHILSALFLMLAVLLQSGQAGGLSGAFGGGGGSQTLFGGRGAATFLSKATAYLGAAFLLISFVLAYAQAHRSAGEGAQRNIIREQLAPAQEPVGPPAGIPAGEGAAPASGEGLLPTGGESDAPPTQPPTEVPSEQGQQTPPPPAGDAPTPGGGL